MSLLLERKLRIFYGLTYLLNRPLIFVKIRHIDIFYNVFYSVLLTLTFVLVNKLCQTTIEQISLRFVISEAVVFAIIPPFLFLEQMLAILRIVFKTFKYRFVNE